MTTNGEVTLEIKDADNVSEADFSKISLDEAFKLLNAGHGGLTSEQVEARLQEYGPNKLPESTRNEFFIFLGYMWNPLAWAMEVAAIISIALLDYADFALIVALLLVNSGISYVEESNADKAIKALTAALAPKAMALRNGKVETIDAIGLVPGDVIIIRLGNIVPADVKILAEEGGGGAAEETPMQIDQAALTGESLPAKKFTGDVAFSGSAIKQGERHAIVYATGVNTFFGRAASLIASTNNVANLQVVMNKIGAMCLCTIGVWILIELLVTFLRYHHFCGSGEDACPALTNMLVIIVGGIPIAMPTVLSVTLALGAFKLAKEGAIVARMSAVEEMAGMDILCSDKTGTLTLNKLSVEPQSVYSPSGMDLPQVMKMAALSANTTTEEPIDVVLEQSYPEFASLKTEYKLLKYVPFNPTDKFTMATVREEKTGRVFRLLKGSPQVIVKKAHNRDVIAPIVESKIVEFANRGFRSLGVALAEGDGVSSGTEWVMIGLVPMFDPPRHDTKTTIEQCLVQGIQVKMITGDHLLIGIETAKMLGMGRAMFTAEQLHKAKQGDKTALGPYKSVTDMVERANGFAEVFPEHKFEIVQILQDAHHICGMTGDGVNDAPALKKADVGIAVAGATDAARGAADIVLTEPGLSAISTAVIGARKIFQRMTTYSKYTVAMTFRICFTFGLLTVIYDWYFPTILIVILAVFNDGAMIALSKDRVVASRMPNTWNLRNIFIMGIVYGLYLTLSSWVLYQVAVKSNFFSDHVGLNSLDDRHDRLIGWCTRRFSTTYDMDGPACQVPQYAAQRPVQCAEASVLDQCLTEQKYVRGAMMRTLLYVQISVSGQALVFVVRNQGYSLFERAGLLTYIAFFLAQAGATLIGIFGFNGYNYPKEGYSDCAFCQQSTGKPVHYFMGKVPRHHTEGAATASIIGCLGYVIVAWVWSAIWYMGLDPIKFALCWILNEDGFRNRKAFEEAQAKSQALDRRSRESNPDANTHDLHGVLGATHLNPLGRASLTKPVNQYIQSASAAIVPIARNSAGLHRVSNDPHKMGEIARRSRMLPANRKSTDAEKVYSRTSAPKEVAIVPPTAGITIRE